MKKSEQFLTIHPGCVYSLPLFRVVDGVGIAKVQDLQPEIKSELIIQFVKGSKEDNAELIQRKDGILVEQLLGMVAKDLEFKNQELYSEETSKAIDKVKEALFWLEERIKNRTKRGVQGTYRK